MEYSKEFKKLNRAYLQAKLEANEAAAISKHELKPQKDRFEKLESQVYNTMMDRNWKCVLDVISNLYVCLIPKT
jgi:hypothetical protein